MADSILGELVESCVSEAQSLTLTGVTSTNIVQVGGLSAHTLENEIPAYPAVVFAPFGSESIDPNAGTNTRDDITYPVACVIIDAGNQNHTAATLDAKYLWRETLIDHFIHQRLTGVASLTNAVLMNSSINPQPIINLGAWAKNWFLSAFVINYTVRKTRRP